MYLEIVELKIPRVEGKMECWLGHSRSQKCWVQLRFNIVWQLCLLNSEIVHGFDLLLRNGSYMHHGR